MKWLWFCIVTYTMRFHSQEYICIRNKWETRSTTYAQWRLKLLENVCRQLYCSTLLNVASSYPERYKMEPKELKELTLRRPYKCKRVVWSAHGLCVLKERWPTHPVPWTTVPPVLRLDSSGKFPASKFQNGENWTEREMFVTNLGIASTGWLHSADKSHNSAC